MQPVGSENAKSENEPSTQMPLFRSSGIYTLTHARRWKGGSSSSSSSSSEVGPRMTSSPPTFGAQGSCVSESTESAKFGELDDHI